MNISKLSKKGNITFLSKKDCRHSQWGTYKVREIVLDEIGVDSILLKQACLEKFYFNHDVGVSIMLIFIANPDVYNSNE